MRGGGSISYEVDLWGKNRNAAKSADYQVNVSEFDREALRLIVTSDATNFYAQILSLNDRIRIAEFNLKNAEEILRIIEARFGQGSVSGLEVSQQRVAVNNFRAALALLTEQRSTTANALATLLGIAPQSYSVPTADLATLSLPPVNLTPPATLLTARPDIESAEASLLSANADIGVARAAFFPSLTLGLDTVISAGFGGPAAAATRSRRVCSRRSLPAAGSPAIWKMSPRGRKSWQCSTARLCWLRFRKWKMRWQCSRARMTEPCCPAPP